jgi:hypothetical protein
VRLEVDIEKNSAATVVEQAVAFACHPNATDEDRRTAVRTAYELGLAEGRVLGGIEMRNHILAAMRVQS